MSGSRAAMFVGTASCGYSELAARAGASIDGYSLTGVVPSVGPNRMSYFLNLHGPSEPIDTACSSALVAIHRAVRAICAGDCETALVGGVNTIVSPWIHVSFSKAGMLAQDGLCKTFSSRANGYVRGEGVGMLYLKKLSAAERDGDHIYALITGSAENHGGRANSFTAPNPRAQAELIKAAYRDAQIDPRTVSYIETHGTGTALGDPVEIDGLKRAFAELNSAADGGRPGAAYCGLGSVKSNIGHLELAAGIAGVIKVVLQIVHRTLAKSLHCEEVNPLIELEGSPFFIVNETRPWTRPPGGGSRRAGVSSFGFGGANAHVVIEEYMANDLAPTDAPVASTHPAVIVLSARTPTQLRDRAKQLLAHVAVHPYPQQDLLDIAYTLQVGRDAMDQRLGFTVGSVTELRDGLADYLEAPLESGPCGSPFHVGDAGKSTGATVAFDTDEDVQDAIAAWMAKGKCAHLLAAWVNGVHIDWSRLYGAGALYGAHRPRRLSLPTYPFARERYWVQGERQEAPGVAVLHPLLQENASQLDE
ncbi:MAG: beta-ketoacyl synthase N-terminal-like domain-containing protein, partial [Steroidobacteraceae bacterium]